MEVSIALGLYISERNEGIFKDAFLTFSSTPEMCYVQGETLADRVVNLANANWGCSTDLLATFDLVLNKAIKNSLPESEMPTKLLIISDMEFNSACDGQNNLDNIKEKYNLAGYELPEIIFWNVNGRVGNVPARCDQAGVGLVSGFSPAILSNILQGKVESPKQLMINAVVSPRYERVVVK